MGCGCNNGGGGATVLKYRVTTPGGDLDFATRAEAEKHRTDHGIAVPVRAVRVKST